MVVQTSVLMKPSKLANEEIAVTPPLSDGVAPQRWAALNCDCDYDWYRSLKCDAMRCIDT